MPGVPRAPRRLVATLYAYAFLDEFVLLYPLYALLFARTGLSTGQISSLFVLWSLTDARAGGSGRRLGGRRLAAPAALPRPPARRARLRPVGGGPVLSRRSPAGFVLWGAKSALVSGAPGGAGLRGARRQDGRRGPLRPGLGPGAGVRASSPSLAAIVLASPVVALGGYAAVGAASVAAGLAAALVALVLPRTAAAPGNDADDAVGATWRRPRRMDAWCAPSRAGPAAVLLVPAVIAIFMALEEYTPLLAAAGGASERRGAVVGGRPLGSA